MLRDALKHGFSQSDWDAAKKEARAVMIERAKVRGMIPYSDLVKKIKSIRLDAHDPHAGQPTHIPTVTGKEEGVS